MSQGVRCDSLSRDRRADGNLVLTVTAVSFDRPKAMETHKAILFNK